MVYYVLSKNGDLEYRERRPKGAFVEEIIAKLEEGHTVHTMVCFDAFGAVVSSRIMHCHCGQDRGPKHDAVVRGMILAAKDASLKTDG